jgi:hypothetical protein
MTRGMDVKYVYIADMYKDVIDDFCEYMGETEHMLDRETEWPQTKRDLFKDFGDWLVEKAKNE